MVVPLDGDNQLFLKRPEYFYFYFRIVSARTFALSAKATACTSDNRTDKESLIMHLRSAFKKHFV